MSEIFNFQNTIDNNAYFKALPAYIQENIKQCGIQINSEDELRAYAENLMR